MSYHPRIETPEYCNFVTTRSRNSELWFVNNQELEQVILATAAKCSTRYDVSLYALAIPANHAHQVAEFPGSNRADYMRDFNSGVARAVDKYTPEYKGGRFWARRYSAEFLATDADIEEWFFYTVLQSVQDGLVEKISDFPGYNCFYDAVNGIGRRFKIVRWAEYNAAKRRDPSVSVKEYTDTYILKYKRLPGYEDLSQRDYAKLMHKKLEERRMRVVKERKAQGLGFAGKEALLKLQRGALPHKTKTSTATSHRPRVLSKCVESREEVKAWYFAVYFEYKDCSERYRKGELEIEFPEGTYKPPQGGISPPVLH